MTFLAAVAAALAVGTAAAASDLDEAQFRYTRTLAAPAGAPVCLEPDGSLYAHSRVDFPDLRILDARGEQVPWRPEPLPAAVPSQLVGLVARGRRGDVVSVVVDRGPVRDVIDRIALEIPDRVFVGEVVVQGSNTGAEGSYATLSTTPIYGVQGAVDARSTTAVFPPTDYRFLLVQARGVSNVTAASVSRDPQQTPLQSVAAKERRRERARSTAVRLDLGFDNVPVDAIFVRSGTTTYVRQVTVEGSHSGGTFVPLGGGEVARFPGVDLSRLELSARHRYVRVTIENADDAPLEDVRVTAQARPRPLLLAEGYEPPFRLLYGAAGLPAPAYDFERLPAAATGFERAREGTLAPERANELFDPPGETRSFFERNDRLVELALVLAAIVVATGGLLALRRRTAGEEA
ncbi:MAG: hypothetical protein H0U08_05955 [Actinobacteria bacterium]|nr:hypothetical protein [Actinomycetota bacterium]